MRKLEAGDFGGFTYLSSVRLEDRPQFVKILKHLIVNLQVRFYTPSSSLDKRTVGGFLDYDRVTIRPDVPTGDCSRCGLIPQFKLFNLRQTRQITIDLSRLLGLRLDEEMERLMFFFHDNHGLIMGKTAERTATCTPLEREVRRLLQFPTTTNINDVLCSTEKERYSQLWCFLVRALTIMPTTVECEQSFSYFKRTAHINMSEENAKNLLFTLPNLYETISYI